MGEQRYKVGDWVRVKLGQGTALLSENNIYEVLGHSDRKYPIVAVTCSHGDRHELDYEPERFTLYRAAATPATLKIEAGRFYKTRDGRKVGPIIANWCDNEHWPFLWPEQTMYYKPNGFSCPGSAHLHRDDADLIAEWIDEPVAASNDNAKPKFKVGDRVEITANDNYRVNCVGSFGTIKTAPTNAAEWFRVELDDGREFPFWPSEMTVRSSSAPPTTTIVALIENGQPKPSSTPHVHASIGAAEKEAKRLAAKFKGQQFGVFTLTTTHHEPKPVYDHKWQNMAALGLKIDAIKELRAVAGIPQGHAERIVGQFAA